MAAASPMVVKTVAVADDTEFVRDRFRTALENAGHRAVGGCRASLYNAVSEESAEALADYMARFAARV